MRAIVLEKSDSIENRPLRMVELEDPWPNPREVRVKVNYCGVCRTDLHITEGELPAKKTPLVIGHQGVGVIDKLGEGVTRFRIGDKVGFGWLRSTCHRCTFCQNHQENLCENSTYHGYHAHGGFADYTVVPEDFLYHLSPQLPLAETAPLLCAGIIGYRALSKAELPEKGILGLFGFGSSAHIVMQLARARGASIFVVTRGKDHQKLAQKMGADWVGESVYDMPRKLDSAIIFAPAGELVPQALLSLRKGGTLALAGIMMSQIPALDYEKHLFYEKSIHSVTSSTRLDAIALLEEAALNHIRPHVTIYPLKEAGRALTDIKADRIQGSAVLEIG